MISHLCRVGNCFIAHSILWSHEQIKMLHEITKHHVLRETYRIHLVSELQAAWLSHDGTNPVCGFEAHSVVPLFSTGFSQKERPWRDLVAALFAEMSHFLSLPVQQNYEVQCSEQTSAVFCAAYPSKRPGMLAVNFRHIWTSNQMGF